MRERLASGNARFVASVDQDLLSRLLARERTPMFAILACSDSRVDPAKIFSLSLGNAFIVRNMGNNASDPTALGSLEYAVSHLEVKALLVLGHTNCGAVAASYDADQNPNLKAVMDDIDCAKSKLKSCTSQERDMVAEANVRLQMRRLLDASPTIRDAVQSGSLELLGAMYQLSSGKVKFIG
jgi:carbonic anhydrase